LAAASFSGVSPLAGQQLPSNSTIQGTFYFRYLGVDTTTTNAAISALGTLTFDGDGRYTVSGTQLNSNGSGTNTTVSLSASGTYLVLSNGMFKLDGFATANPVRGGVAIGPILVGSSTDSPTLDLFVAIPVSNNASNATLTGSYYSGSLEFPNGDVANPLDTFFSMTANGGGSLGSLSVVGYGNNLGLPCSICVGSTCSSCGPATKDTYTVSGATYTVGPAGNGTMTLPGLSGPTYGVGALLTGAKTLYVSPDGAFFIAGSASGYDMIMGVKALSGSTNTTPLSGLYFMGYLQNDFGGGGLYASQGVYNESGGNGLGYERSTVPGNGSYDSTYSGSFMFSGNGTYCGLFQCAAGAGGNIVIGTGTWGLYALVVYARSPSLSGPGVFLNPQGIVNAASYAPFENAVAPGEFITLFGTGFATRTATAASPPFPATLGNVQATVDGSPMALYEVSPTAIAGVVPYTSRTDRNLVTIQVTSDGTPSNAVQLYSGATSPGVFTLSENGIGDGAILHGVTNLPVTTASPAKVGEVVVLFLSGLGRVNSAVAAGAAGPAPPSGTLATLVNALQGVYIDGVSATINYQGLAPGLAGLYQVNVTIPPGLSFPNGPGTSIDAFIEIDTVDSDSLQATIRISN
jgi:uncharacterized protein (TIGR03437 family)